MFDWGKGGLRRGEPDGWVCGWNGIVREEERTCFYAVVVLDLCEGTMLRLPYTLSLIFFCFSSVHHVAKR